MSFLPGEIVVAIYSKAKNLRNKVYKVIESDYTGTKFRAVTTGGRIKELPNNYHFQRLDQHESRLATEIEWADNAVTRAERRSANARVARNQFASQKDQINSWFKV